MNTRALLCSVLALAVPLCGCRRVIRSAADEVRLSSWVTDTESASARLDFIGDNARFMIDGNGESAEITGLCVIDDSRIVILDPLERYCFGYSVCGETLTLTYDGELLKMSREEPDTEQLLLNCPT